MSTQDDLRTVTVPRQAGPSDPPLTEPAPVPTAGIPGHDRPLTSEEKQFLVGASITFGGLALMIVTFLLLATQVW